MALIQAAIAISLMIPIFLNSEKIADFFEDYENSDLTELYKRYKMYLESMMYFVFEIWRICLVLDSVSHPFFLFCPFYQLTHYFIRFYK
jgi:hypothetical protein